MRALVAVACVAVIAMAGLFFWRDHEARAAVAARQARADRIAECAQAMDDLRPYYRGETPEAAALKTKIVNCRMSGLISDAVWKERYGG